MTRFSLTGATREVICWKGRAEEAVKIVARAGDVPATLRGARIQSFAALAIGSGGQVLFRATLGGHDSVKEGNSEVLLAWKDASNSVAALIREGQTILPFGRVRQFSTLVDGPRGPGADRGWFGRSAFRRLGLRGWV